MTIAHPHWSGLTLADALSIDAAHAVEIYNHGCAVGCDRESGGHVLDLLLSEGRDLTVIATDDAHFTEPDHFGGWVMVRAEANAPELLLQALKDGAFYTSQGPEIRDVELTDEHVLVTCSAASSVIVQGRGQAAAVTHGSAMTQARVPIGRFDAAPWIRITVIDAARRRAWTNPIWL